MRRTCHSSRVSPSTTLNRQKVVRAQINLDRLKNDDLILLSTKLTQLQQRLDKAKNDLKIWKSKKIYQCLSTSQDSQSSDDSYNEQQLDIQALCQEVNQDEIERKIYLKKQQMIENGEFDEMDRAREQKELKLQEQNQIKSIQQAPLLDTSTISNSLQISTYSAFVRGIQVDQEASDISMPFSPLASQAQEKKKKFQFESQAQKEKQKEQTLNHMVEGINEQDQADIKDFLDSFVFNDSPMRLSKLKGQHNVQSKTSLIHLRQSQIINEEQQKQEVKERATVVGLRNSIKYQDEKLPPHLQHSKSLQNSPQKSVDSQQFSRKQLSSPSFACDQSFSTATTPQVSFIQNPPTQQWQDFMANSRLHTIESIKQQDLLKRKMSQQPPPFKRIQLQNRYSEVLLSKQNFYMPSGQQQLGSLMGSNGKKDIFIHRLLTGIRRAVNIFSDYQLAHYRNISSQILEKQPNNQQAHLIMGQIAFCCMDYHTALHHFNQAIEPHLKVVKKIFQKKKKVEKSNDRVQTAPYLWKGMTLLELYQDSTEVKQKKKYMIECELTLISAYKTDKSNLNTLWMLFHLARLNQLQKKGSKRRFKMRFKAKDYYRKIYSIDQYIGSIAYADQMYYLQQNKQKKAISTLLALVKKQPNRITATLRLWRYLYESESKVHNQKSLDLAESLFFSKKKNQDIQDLQNIKIILYAKSLIKMGENQICFRLLQSKFAQSPHISFLLLYLAKYIIKTKSKNCYGCAIGILNECLRCCISERYPQIHFWLARAYQEVNHTHHMMNQYSLSRGNSQNLLSNKKRSKVEAVVKENAHLTKLYNELNREIKYKDKLSLKEIQQILEDMSQYSEFSARYYQAKISLDIYGNKCMQINQNLGNTTRAQKILIQLDDTSQYDITAGLQYLQILHSSRSWQQIDCFAYKLLKKTRNNPLIPTDQWARAILWRAKSLFKRNKVKKSLGVLKQLYSAFPQVPITRTQNFAPYDPFVQENGDKIQQFQQNYEEDIQPLDTISQSSGPVLGKSIIQKIGPITNQRHETISSNSRSSGLGDDFDSHKRGTSGYLQNILMNKTTSFNPQQSIKQQDSSGYLSLEEIIANNSILQDSLDRDSINQDLVRKSVLTQKLSLKIQDVRKCKTNVPDYAKFTVYSDPTFLYYIGKYCAKSGMFLKQGKQALQDYLELMNTELTPARNNTNQAYNAAKGQFWLSIVLFKMRQIDQCAQAFKQAKTSLFTVQNRKKHWVCEKMLSLIQMRRTSINFGSG